MPLDEGTRRLLDEMIAASPSVETLEPEEAREAARARRLAAPGNEVVELPRVQDLTIPGPAGRIPVRVYWPSLDGGDPVVVYFHGGGWVLGDIDSHDLVCRRLARDSQCLFVSVDYRLAPEHKFPAAIDDAYAATSWVAANREKLRASPQGLAVAGDSAGGNLAAAVTLLARDRGAPPIDHQVLVYPVLDHRFDTASYFENGTDYFVTRAAMEWYWRQYLRTDVDGDDQRASPLRAASLDLLPSALIITAEFDPLRDEGESYGRRLQEAGVPAVISRYDGMFHGFFSQTAVVPRAYDAQQEVAAAVRKALRIGQTATSKLTSRVDLARRSPGD